MGPLLAQSAGLRIGAFDDKAELQQLELGPSKQTLAKAFCYFGVMAMKPTSLNDLPAALEGKPSGVYPAASGNGSFAVT